MDALSEVERHPPAQGGTPRSPLLLHGLLVHSDGDAAPEAAGAALVAVSLVHRAGPHRVLGLAHVLAVAADGSLQVNVTFLVRLDFLLEADLPECPISS